MSDTVLSLSGGVDSTTLLSLLLDEGYKVHPVAFMYGSKHNKYELESAVKVCQYYGIDLQMIDVSQLFSTFSSSLLKTGGDIPEGHYEEESMKSTVVPCRNFIFASILTGVAVDVGAKGVALGVHAGDHAIYPDCRHEFILELKNTVREVSEGVVRVLTPFLFKTKVGIVAEAVRLKAPLYLTRTCYKDQPDECGKCGSCVEKAEAYKANGLTVNHGKTAQNPAV